MQKIWYGYSPTLNKVCFFNSDPGSGSSSGGSGSSRYGNLEATGSFTVENGQVSNLQIESIDSSQRQTQPV